MKSLLASLIIAVVAGPAVAGPDFVTRSPRGHALAASQASSEIGPVDDVVFAHDSTQLLDSSYTQIESAARWLAANPSYRIVLEGYADSIGNVLYNEDLATRRAFQVRQHLVGQGISPDRIVMVVYGETRARGGSNVLDRRVVMWGTNLDPAQIAKASLDRKNAVSVAWTHGKARFTETRNRRTIVGTR